MLARYAFAILALTLWNLASANTVENFIIAGKPVTLSVPTIAAPGKPWLWVGEFGGHLKSLEDELVKDGWHVAYLQMGDEYGSPAAMKVWEKLYEELHDKRGLSAKPALLGISRGGLYVNSWIRLHPDHASVLYLDNGVCDIRSWPGGFQLTHKSNGSLDDWNHYKTVFHYADDTAALAESVHPTDGMLPAIKAGVLLICCYGTADHTVPYEDNSALLVKLWQKNGAAVKLFPKVGGDHHPHGLPDPKPLIDALIAGVKSHDPPSL
jgi:hypothetical protein